MIRGFLLKHIRPILKKLGIYDWSFRCFFNVYNKYCYVVNFFNKKFRKTALIFTYHRIANVSADPQLLCVAPELFSAQIKFFKENFEVISLSELGNRVRRNSLMGGEAVITFDDGYRDNLLNALPILEKFSIPTTIFICTSQIGEEASFPWDIEYLKKDRANFLSVDDIKSLANNPLIEIGAHTHSHARLSTLPYNQQYEEISRNQKILSDITQKPIVSFAYPFGGLFDYDLNTKQILDRLGFKQICNTSERVITNSTSSNNLPRFNMRSYSVPDLEKWYK